MRLMDLRESDILDTSVDTEEDIGSGGHLEERFGMFLCYRIKLLKISRILLGN